MTSNLNIYRSAKLLIDQHGADISPDTAVNLDHVRLLGRVVDALMKRAVPGK